MPSQNPMTTSSGPTFNKEAHVRYWLRCLKTLLPTQYTSMDTIRMTLAFFILSALDLLSALQTRTSNVEREAYVDWIYRSQHPSGGFRGSPATSLGLQSGRQNEHWDPPNLAATFFALISLLVLGDDLARLEHRGCLDLLPKLQRGDGSFGELLGEDGKPQGGTSMRYAYFAAAIRWILRGGKRPSAEADVDVPSLLKYINSSKVHMNSNTLYWIILFVPKANDICQTYDHGYSEAAYNEAHAGLTYCAISALAFLDDLPQKASSFSGKAGLEDTVHWLVSRQSALNADGDDPRHDHTTQDVHAITSHHNSPISHHLAQPPPALDEAASQCAGFSGRINKPADTCYSFWVLSHADLISSYLNRNFLLNRTQHRIGGFGKLPGDVPDILHSYLGLAALATLGEEGLKPLDAALCVSVETKTRLEGLKWRSS
ncbi:MAG: hypothetical protein M1833_001299 [Piccolia ochrophora]|nr:MAG: hypothetical protein M1833_001299 [Piccolia ochrophora]